MAHGISDGPQISSRPRDFYFGARLELGSGEFEMREKEKVPQFAVRVAGQLRDTVLAI